MIDVAFVTANVSARLSASLVQVAGDTETWQEYASQLVGPRGQVFLANTTHTAGAAMRNLPSSQKLRRLFFIGHGGRDTRTRQMGFVVSMQETGSGIDGIRTTCLLPPSRAIDEYSGRPAANRDWASDASTRFWSAAADRVHPRRGVQVYFLMCGIGNELVYAHAVRSRLAPPSARRDVGDRVRVFMYRGTYVVRRDTIERSRAGRRSTSVDYVVAHYDPDGTEHRAPPSPRRNEIAPTDLVVPR